MKANKILLILVLVLVLCLAVACDNLPFGCNHTDADNDGLCDLCKQAMPCDHLDANGDNLCDNCNQKVDIPVCIVHVDENQDNRCDACGIEVNISTPPDGECAHADADADKICDLCQKSVVINFNLLGVNDVHGKFLSSDVQPGIGGMSTYMQSIKQSNANTIFFSTGDMWQGSAEVGLTYGNLMTDWMSDMGFAFMTLGNHEFDWGGSYIQQNSDRANFPFLAINVYEESTNQLAPFCQPSVLVDLGDVQVGFIGAIGDCYSSISGDMSQGYYFKVGDELTALVKAESANLRTQGADFIVYSLHDGASYSDVSNNKISDATLSAYYDISLSQGYVDIVFEGHSHSYYTAIDSQGIWHSQGGGDNTRGFIKTNVTYNLVTKQSKVEAPALAGKSNYEQLADHQIVTDLKAEYSQVIQKTQSVVGTNPSYMDSGSLRVLMASLYANLAEQFPQYDIVFGGGYLSCRSPGELLAGDVKYGDLYMLFPFNNTLAVCQIDGRTLRNNFMNNRYYYLSYTEYGNSVRNSIDPNGTYYIITDSYNYNFEQNVGKVIPVATYADGFARDLMADYFGGDDPDKVTLTDGNYYTIKQLLDYGDTMLDGAKVGSYVTVGKVTEISSTKYGNMYIADELGNSIYVYGMYDQDGNLYQNMENKPQVGDVIIIKGTLYRYVSSSGVKMEIENAVVQTVASAEDSSQPANIPQIIAVGMGLQNNSTSSQNYYVKGEVASVDEQTGELVITDQFGIQITVVVDYSTVTTIPTQGNTVVIYGAVTRAQIDTYQILCQTLVIQ